MRVRFDCRTLLRNSRFLRRSRSALTSPSNGTGWTSPRLVGARLGVGVLELEFVLAAGLEVVLGWDGGHI